MPIYKILNKNCEEIKMWKYWHTIALIVIITVIYIIGLISPANKILQTCMLTMLGMILFTMFVSHGVTGYFLYGWLINEQNRISLSRLQMFLWTVMILSAFIAAVFANFQLNPQLGVLDIGIPKELWWAMGISTTSLVASPLILSNESKILQGMRKKKKGVLDRVKCNTPSISDLFRGEFESNKDIVDLSRIQNLFFTLMLVSAYGAILWTVMDEATKNKELITKFPEINSSLIALLAISHSGYLVMKGKQK